MISYMFQTFIVQPIYNILVALYGVLPGHDLGVSLILFTVLIRLLLWPLLKKQLHQGKVMRELQPELKKVKKAAAGDKQKEAALMMELYKEKGISPFGSIGLTIVQLPIFIGVFQAARDLTEGDYIGKLSTFTYSFVRDIPHIQSVIADSKNFDFVSFGFIDLSNKAFENGAVYIPVLVLAIAATVFQFVQSKQILPQPKEKKSLRDILRGSAATGKQPDQEDMTAAMTGTMLYLMPILTMMFAIASQGAMVMYLLASSLIGIFQQSLIFKKDTNEMEAEVVSVKKSPESKKNIQEAQIIEPEQVSNKEEKSEQKVNKKGKVVTKTRIISPSGGDSQSQNKTRSKRKSKKRRK
jgi:YidC/Oxa1 family membrane protein insertase